jgi:hypothetical protein
MLKAVKKLRRRVKSPNPRKRANSLAQKAIAFAERCWKAGTKVWSVRGAAIITTLAALVSVIQILVVVHGKLVILPFEVRGDQNTPSELGASFAQSLSIALNEYRQLFPSLKPNDSRQVLTSKNYSDLVQSFMSDLPFVEIPRTSPLNKGAAVLDAIKIGPISIPVSQIIFENLAFFHDDTLRGSLEIWGGDLVARISLSGNEKTIVVTASKEEGYRTLITRATVELLQEKKWIVPIPMKLSALAMFSDGLRNYLDFDAYGEERFIKAAREKYQAALLADSNADLARLHLGAAQYVSTEPAIIAKAIENFSLLLGNPHYARAAKIGYVASVLRFITREGGCSAIYRFLTPMLQVASSWEQSGKPPLEAEELLLWSGTFRLAVGYLLPGKSCAKWVQSILGVDDIDVVFTKAQQGYQQALTKIAEPNRYSEGEVTRFRFHVSLSLKYLLDDVVDHSILTRKPNLEFASAALEAGKEIQAQKDKLSEAQQRFFVPSIAGSIADSYLRIAKIKESDPAETRQLVSAAIDQLRIALRSSEPPTVQWALFRLADLELGRSDAGASLEWLIKAYGHVPSFATAFDESYFPFGMLLERPAQRCEAIRLFKRGSAAGSIASRLLLVDALRRQGDERGASALAESLRESIESSTKWMGDVIRQKLSFVQAKLEPERLNSLDLKNLWERLGRPDPRKEFLRFDIFEMAMIAKDEKLLTMLKADILFPNYHQPEVVKPDC